MNSFDENGVPAMLGVVLAGGESSRFGGQKALALLEGRPMAAWALDALVPHSSLAVVVTNDSSLGVELGVSTREDLIPGLGPLGGLITALSWAREEGLGGAILLACDLPLVSPPFLGRILSFPRVEGRALVPASPGPLGLEPLCAAYDVSCLEAALELAGSRRRSMRALLDLVGYTLVPMESLGSEEEVALAFANVNTREQISEVEKVLHARRANPSSFTCESRRGA